MYELNLSTRSFRGLYALFLFHGSPQCVLFWNFEFSPCSQNHPSQKLSSFFDRIQYSLGPLNESSE